MIARLFAVALGILATASARAAEAEMHFAPVENLEHIDVDLIRSASRSIDLAMYTLTDWPIIGALNEARDRGVTVRIVLDPSVRQAYPQLAELAGVVRVKKPGPLMHIKAYAVDGSLLRTGSANMSPSGLKQQDNDLIVLREPALVAKFEARFAAIYAAAEPMRIEAPPSRVAVAGVAPACRIKGNISRKGERIYHEPGERDYERIVMDTTKGKRWFCSTEEAEAAGWRHALR